MVYSIFSSNIFSVTICDPNILNLKKKQNVLKLSCQELWGLDSSSIEEFGLWEDLQCYPNTLNSQYMKGGGQGQGAKDQFNWIIFVFMFIFQLQPWEKNWQIHTFFPPHYCIVWINRKGTTSRVNWLSTWTLYLSLALCVDHLSIISTERRVQQSTTSYMF